MSATGSLSPEVRRLATALATARNAAERARAANPDDGGSANLDHCCLMAKGLPAAVVRKAAEAAGVGVTFERATKWWWPRRWSLSIGAGQAGLRTRMVQAATHALRRAGYDAVTWYQVD